jgi:putative protease
MQKKIEIMSPVGNFETLAAAIQGGADSVYFGVAQLNMRAKSANNFTVDDLSEIVSICKEHNVKTYLALNTIIYDHDLVLMKYLIDEAKKNNITAIICSDIAVLNYAFEKKIELHASTQLNISNIEAVKFFAKYVDVMVLARELTLQQVRQIYDTIQLEQIKGPSGKLIELEIFAHGALCMAISGKCYLSLHEFNSSANRGACQQTCRRAYTVTDKETGYQLEIDNEYIMSPKDLSTLNFLDKVIKSGVTVLKIEGRARPPEYVRTTTEIYKEAVLAVLTDAYTTEKIEMWNQKLERVFNRGFWDGYYLGKTLGEWSDIYGSRATRKKFYVGKVTNYFAKIKVAEIYIMAGEIVKRDEILFIGNKTGAIEYSVPDIKKEDIIVEKAIKGDIISIFIDEDIRRNDKVYKLISTDFD